MEWALELFLVVMLGATLFHATRLERALGVLKRDRAELEELVEGFNESTRQAEQGVERLRQATDGAGKQIARQIDAALALKDELAFLLERSERAADRLDRLVRSSRPLASEPARPSHPQASEPARSSRPPASEPARPVRPLTSELARSSRPLTSEPIRTTEADSAPLRAAEPARSVEPEPSSADQRIRSQAERDLLKALRMTR